MRKVSGKEVNDFLKNHGDTEMGVSVKQQLGITDTNPAGTAQKTPKDVVRPSKKVSSQTKKADELRYLWLSAHVILICITVTWMPLRLLVAIVLFWLAWLHFRSSKK